MKKIIGLLLMLVTMTATAQKDVTKFLGIPVDGYKAEMKKKLIDKGFEYNAKDDAFTGEFNGRNVNLFIATNNNKVWRIIVCDANTSNESDIKIRFNTLCDQFAKNKKYVSANLGMKDFKLSEDEDISYEMMVNSKRYEAAYYQILDPEKTDSVALKKRINDALLLEYTQEQIDNPTEKQAKGIQRIIEDETIHFSYDHMTKKFVWFMIKQSSYKGYYISLFYDNEYNHSDGEDL
jgi:hypothetical protein